MDFKVGDIIKHSGHGRVRIVVAINGHRIETKQIIDNEVRDSIQTFSIIYLQSWYRRLTKLEKALA